jgi:CRISPR system Cascade subunit CasE
MYLSKVAIPKPELAQFATTRGLPRQLTTNYLVHSVLAEAFSGCPTPFVSQDKGRILRVLFYSDEDAKGLKTKAELGASPEAYEAIQWDETAAKPMPDPFPESIEFQFELQACPVIRKASAGAGKNKEGEVREWDEGDELDAFLARQWSSEEELSRAEVYCDWLARQFEARGGAELVETTLEGFALTEMTRRSNGPDRSVHSMDRPEATLTGVLRVTDGSAFMSILRSGLGRHKSFGYGLLKVRPT